MAIERTLIIIKPDAVQRGLTGEIIKRFEQRGLRIIGMKFLRISRPLAEKHYAVHAERPFFASLVNYITSSPVVVIALEGTNARERAGARCPNGGSCCARLGDGRCARSGPGLNPGPEGGGGEDRIGGHQGS